MQHEGQQGFSDVQLVQTDLHHTSEDNAVQNLQQYGSYTLVSSAESPAVHEQFITVDNIHSAYDTSHSDGNCDNNKYGAAVTWYGSLDEHAATNPGGFSQENQTEHADWNSQQGLHYTTVAKKNAPGDVSRHDTPTSVFDIFNALSIVHPQSPRARAVQHTTSKLFYMTCCMHIFIVPGAPCRPELSTNLAAVCTEVSPKSAT